MSQNWYYARGNQQFGPITIEQLQGLLSTGQVQHADLVWTEGMAQWATANSVPQLAGPARFTPAPPPPVVQPVMQQPVVQQPMPASPVMPNPAAPNVYAAPNAYGQQPFSAQPIVNAPPWPAQGVPAGVVGYQSGFDQSQIYAGFWMRFAASIIDGILTGIAGAIVGGVIGGIAGASGIRQNSPQWIGVTLFIQGLSALMTWLYFAFMESSNYQGTLGKILVGIKVTDLEGGRIGFGRATGRHFAKFISMLTLFIGYMMAGWTERKQALHDMLASALVVKRTV